MQARCRDRSGLGGRGGTARGGTSRRHRGWPPRRSGLQRHSRQARHLVPHAVAFHPEVQQEFEDAALRSAAIRPSPGEGYIDQVEAATARAVQAPITGAPLGPLCRVFVKRFPYFALNAVEASRNYVVAVAHVRQHPGFWRLRSQRQDETGIPMRAAGSHAMAPAAARPHPGGRGCRRSPRRTDPNRDPAGA